MRRRVAIAVIAAVVAALVLVGMGTLVLSRSAARRSAEHDLQGQAAAVADLVATLGTTTREDGTTASRLGPATLKRISESFDVREIGLVVIGPGGREFGRLPDGVALSAAEDATVRGGGEVSGAAVGGGIYAAAGRPVGQSIIVVGIAGTTRALFSGAAGWFLLSSILVVGLAIALAMWIGSRLARPVRQATEVTERIAGGDLAARLPEPARGDRDETAVLARSVNTMADALQRSRGLEQQFLMSVSHDLRTPLTNIRGYAEAIADGATAPEDGAAVILREEARLERLVRDLLDLARLDARQFTLHPRVLDLTAVVADAAGSHRAEVTAAGRTLDVRAGPPAPVVADGDRLGQVVGNLVGNATRYAATGVVVQTSVEDRSDRGRWAVVQVWNDGTSIAEADLPFVFERLYQGADQPDRSESGSGLGLAIVRELVAAMGGEVGAIAPSTGGTAFWFRLPLHDGTAIGRPGSALPD